MLKLLLLSIVSLLVFLQIQYINCDAFDTAQEKLETLGYAINGTSAATEDALQSEWATLSSWADDMDAKGVTLLSNAKASTDETVVSLRTLAESAGVDATLCFEDPLDLLEALPDQVDAFLKDCIATRVTDADKTQERAKSLIEQTYNRVNAISTQVANCPSETCVEPIIDFIDLQQDYLTTRITLETTRVSSLFDLLRVAIDECQQWSVARFTINATAIVNDIEDCINGLAQ